MAEITQQTQLRPSNNHDPSRDKSPSRHNSTPGLFLTLPSNFSPSTMGSSSSPRGSIASSGSSTPPGNNRSRASPTTHHNHSWEDLRRLFLVSLEKLCRLEPESLPFRQPVDPIALGIPDYADIIRKPMDLQTIRLKMNSGKYTDPYLYVDDVLRMLDNALVYNREGSKVWNYAAKLAEVFMVEVNPVMAHLGYRKGRTNGFQYNSDVVSCHGRPVCLVFKGQGYWKGTGLGLEFNLCEKCYKENEQRENEIPDLIPQQHESSFVFTINNSKVYSPAAELHKSHLRDAEMSRQLVLREFLRMLMEDKSNESVWKMLKCNGKLSGEFLEYVKRRRGLNQEYGMDQIDMLVSRLEGLRVGDTCSVSSSGSTSSDKEVGSSGETQVPETDNGHATE